MVLSRILKTLSDNFSDVSPDGLVLSQDGLESFWHEMFDAKAFGSVKEMDVVWDGIDPDLKFCSLANGDETPASIYMNQRHILMAAERGYDPNRFTKQRKPDVLDEWSVENGFGLTDEFVERRSAGRMWSANFLNSQKIPHGEKPAFEAA